MTSLRPRADHQATVSRRLELLTAEVGGTREEPGRPPDLEQGAEREPGPAEDDAWLAGHTRIRPLRAVPDGPPREVPTPPPAAESSLVAPVPVPGRHAARRSAGGVLPESLRGRVALGPGQLAVVAVLVAVGIAVTGWWLVRGDPHRLEAPPPPSPGAVAGSTSASPLTEVSPVGGSPSGAGAAPGATTGASAGTVTVDVAGKVKRPGIVVLDSGARVVDALEAAGGARRGVDLSSLNLARLLVDGEQIAVGVPAPVGAAAAAGAPAAPGAAGPLVNLNTATQPELEGLPEVGPVTAEAILAWRQEHGGFSSVDELLEVDGIGDATLAKIAPHVTV